MKIQIDFYGWLRNAGLSTIAGLPIAYAVKPYDPLMAGVIGGFLAGSWLIVIIFWLGKRNGIEIK